MTPPFRDWLPEETREQEPGTSLSLVWLLTATKLVNVCGDSVDLSIRKT